MKKLIPSILFSFIVIFVLNLAACGGNNSAQNEKGKEYTSAFICPMHCDGSGSSEAGNCPACKMAYVENKDAKKADAYDHHDHDHDHHGHDHDHDHSH